MNSIQNTNKLIFDEISISRLVVYFIISKNLLCPPLLEPSLKLRFTMSAKGDALPCLGEGGSFLLFFQFLLRTYLAFGTTNLIHLIFLTKNNEIFFRQIFFPISPISSAVSRLCHSLKNSLSQSGCKDIN